MPKRKPSTSEKEMPKAEVTLLQADPNSILAPDFKTVYTNFVSSALSPVDLFVVFGENLGPGPDGRMMVSQKVKVIMSPIEAKIVAATLVALIKGYEAKFGKIEVPQEVMQPKMEGV